MAMAQTVLLSDADVLIDYRQYLACTNTQTTRGIVEPAHHPPDPFLVLSQLEGHKLIDAIPIAVLVEHQHLHSTVENLPVFVGMAVGTAFVYFGEFGAYALLWFHRLPVVLDSPTLMRCSQTRKNYP